MNMIGKEEKDAKKEINERNKWMSSPS